jgi:hypothetical protein
MSSPSLLNNPFSRRQLLARSANGFGALALSALLAERDYGAAAPDLASPLAARPGHHPARATSVIFLYMDGGPSQMDTFDPKPRLNREDGKPIHMPVPASQFTPAGSAGRVMGSPFRFNRHGQSGIDISELFPHVAGCADDLCVVRSMYSDFSEHGNANLFLHTGSARQGRPSMGAWVTYGLGSVCRDLPGFVVLKGGNIPTGGPANFDGGFLPALYSGSIFRDTTAPIANLQRSESRNDLQLGKLDLLRRLDRQVVNRLGPDDVLESSIANYELACRMQLSVPELLDLQGESPATRRLYGVDDETTHAFASQCLLARRLVERGVRFVEVTPPGIPGINRWDSHDKLQDAHSRLARAVDQPIAALLRDLKARGMLEQTLVVWGGEFGRTPIAQGAATGRDHNPYGFTMWLAGGGVRGGLIHGATDDYGYFAIQDKVHIHDLHATLLHLLGLDHKRLIYRFGGRDMRLTDVHGEVVHALLA